jgi:hypothetical protein
MHRTVDPLKKGNGGENLAATGSLIVRPPAGVNGCATGSAT